MFSQSKDSDFFSFYKGGHNLEKPIKYILFDISNRNCKKEIDNKIFFYIGGETFIFDSKINKIKLLDYDYLKKHKIEDATKLSDNEYLYFKKTTTEYQKHTKLPIPNSMPVSRNHKYFKVFVFEQKNTKTLIKYEVDWIYSSF